MKLQTREKRMLIGLAVVAVISAAILYRVYNPSVKEPFVETSSAPQTETSSETGSSSSPRVPSGSRSRGASGGSSTSSSMGRNVSLEEFNRHSAAQDCWVLIDGEVWDISNYLNELRNEAKKAQSFCGTVGFEVGYLEGNDTLKQKIEDLSSKIGVIA